jgi:PAS domain S-box-containing protein
MLKSAVKSISGRYNVEEKTDFYKIIGFHLFIGFGAIAGLIMFLVDLIGSSANACLPGDISVLILFGVSFYGLRQISFNWAVRIFFLVPVVPYLFFVSGSIAIIPNQQSIPYTLWSLVPFFFYFLIFSDKKRDLVVFWVLSMLTLFIHTIQAGLFNFVLNFKWAGDIHFLNPFLTLTAFFFLTILLSFRFQNKIDYLHQQKEETDQLINQVSRSFPQGLMLLELATDDFGTPSHLMIRKTNLAFERLFKITSRELRDQNADDVLPKVFRGAFDWNKEILNSQKNQFSFYLERLDKYFDVDVLRLGNNQIISLFIDKTKDKQQIIELEENKLRYQVLLEAIPDLFFIIDRDGVYVDFVFKASEALKIKPDDIIGNSIFEVGFSEKMASKIYQCIRHCIEFDSIETIEYALEINGGSALFEMRIVRLNENSVISLARDITIRKMAELKLEEAKNKAEDADRLKTAFLANISHEIRTPMNAIIGFSRMLGSSDFDEEEKNKFIDIIINNGKLLLSLINDMISLSKIESNTLVVRKATCRINDMMVNLYKEFNEDLMEKGNVRLKISCENSNPKFSIVTDQNLLQSVLYKLIDNGIKFTEIGEVEFGYQLLDSATISFYVRDTGIGISEKDQNRIFERFHQLDNRTIRDYEGTGLGLSIAQHYVKLLDGELNVKSKLGTGSLFSFKIPYAREESPLKIVR